MKVLVTGASGFIGRELVGYLVSRGHEVSALVRQPIRLEVDQVFIEDISGVGPEAFDARDAVIHLAGLSDDRESLDDFYENANVLGTQAVVTSCITAGVRRLIFLSSVKVHGECSLAPIGPESNVCPQSAYARSKLAAERIILDTQEIQPFVLRIPAVYGPGVKGNFASLISCVRSGVPLPFGSIKARRSYLGVWNLLDFIATCLETTTEGGVYYVADPAAYVLPELLKELADALHTSPRLLRVPESALFVLGVLLGRRESVEKLLNSLVVDIEDTTRRTGWSPPYTTAQCLRAMFGVEMKPDRIPMPSRPAKTVVGSGAEEK